jgi:hypothetical protein
MMSDSGGLYFGVAQSMQYKLLAAHSACSIAWLALVAKSAK